MEWTQEDDIFLAENVLKHIREGSTQLAAFDEVGKKLKRSTASCGFRWNAVVRHQYHGAIALAKKQRKDIKIKQSTDKLNNVRALLSQIEKECEFKTVDDYSIFMNLSIKIMEEVSKIK